MIEQNFNESNFEEKVEKNLKLLLEHPQKFENIFTELFDQDFVSQLNYITSFLQPIFLVITVLKFIFFF